MTEDGKMQDPYGNVLARFDTWQGRVPAGYRANFLGALARVDRLYPGAYLAALEVRAAQDYDDKPARPHPSGTDYYETGAVLEAVLQARGHFSMMELGAGVGPWTTLAARAARKCGLLLRHFVAVEGEPTRFSWLEENLDINGVAPSERKLIRGVVAPSTARDFKVYFPVGAPRFAGHTARVQSVELEEKARHKSVNYVGRSEDATLEPAPVVCLRDLLEERPEGFDLAHIDIQGLEGRVLRDAAPLLQTRLRAVAVGTHGPEIYSDLEQLFEGLGWIKAFGFQGNSEFEVEGTTISTRGLDGFQHWINPNLRSSYLA